jgi:hypothetical protein
MKNTATVFSTPLTAIFFQWTYGAMLHFHHKLNVTCNSPQWGDKMYFIMQINLFFFQTVDCHCSSLTGLQNISTFNKLNTVLIPYHTSILNSVRELKSTVKVGLSSTG